MTVPEDIRQRVESDFGSQAAEEIYQFLVERIPEGLPNGTRPRHLRCILHLAAGDRDRLEKAIELCLLDTRDLMVAAEYDSVPSGDWVQKRDFSKPFKESGTRRS